MTLKKQFKWMTVVAMFVALLLIFAIPVARTFAQGGDTNRAAASTGSAFTYQGNLEKSGSGVSDTCSFDFKLYDAATGGNQVGSTVSKSGVSVSNGKFTAELDFGSSAFNGDARYLDVQVQCTGDFGMVALSPRTALNGTPYALSLRPGVDVNGSDATGRIFGAVNNDTTGSNAAIYGESKSAAGAGISGWNTNSSGGYGIYGNSTASGGTPYGVYGIASDAGSATSYGVYGKSNSSFGTGVGGISPQNGVYGEASNTSGATWGVYGKSNSASGYGVYSSGNAHVEGQLTWKAMTGTISIPGLAFQPFDGAGILVRDISGGGVTPSSSSSVLSYAPIQLPNNATVTKLSFYWADSSNSNGNVSLYRTDMQGNENAMAAAFSSGGSSGGGGGTTVTSSSSTTTISSAAIDNTAYSYYLYLNLPIDSNGASIKAYGVTVEYTITQPY